jgi:hypothetical protein
VIAAEVTNCAHDAPAYAPTVNGAKQREVLALVGHGLSDDPHSTESVARNALRRSAYEP